MPLQDINDAIVQHGLAPSAIARKFSCDLSAVFRRLATLPTARDVGQIGLVVCDNSGTLTFRKPVDGFSMPRFGATCPLWPLFQALSRPNSPIRTEVEFAGYHPQRFRTFAVAQPSGPVDFDSRQFFEATMLIIPADAVGGGQSNEVLPIGSSCRICPRMACAARREVSILTAGF